jgi:hypothetical protein
LSADPYKDDAVEPSAARPPNIDAHIDAHIDARVIVGTFANPL